MKRSLILTLFSFLVLAQISWADVPQTVSYQGVLKDAGELANGAYTLRFKLYDVATGGTALGTPEWSEDHSIDVTNGIFSVILGSNISFASSAIYFNAPYWLEIAIVDGATVTTLSERTMLTAAPYAIKSRGVVTATSDFYGSTLGVGTTSPKANLQVVGNWTLGTEGMPPSGFDNWLNAGNAILYEGGGLDYAHHFSAYGGGDIARFGISPGIGQAPDSRVVITNSGSVGIGVSPPAEVLDVNGSIRVSNGLYSSGVLSLNSDTAFDMKLNDGNPGNVLIATGGGNVGIGTPTPTTKLYIASPNADGILLSDSSSGKVSATLLNFETVGGQLTLRDADGNTQTRLRGYAANGVQAYFTAGNVGIGTAFPDTNFKLEVVGGVKADSIKLATAAERWYAIPASGFISADNETSIESQPYAVWGTSLSDTAMFMTRNVKLNAPVNLPHGATITEFHVGMTDDSTPLDIAANLYMVSGNSTSASTIAPLSSTGQSATFTVSSTGLNQVVDNQNYTYTVRVEWTMPDLSWAGVAVTDLQLRNARIKYTVDQPLP